MTGAAIEVAGLSKSYGHIEALVNASLQVPAGQVFGLVGPNGAGKSTIIKAICGILKPDSGSVSVLGMEAGRERFAVRRRLGYMPQTPSLYDDLSPFENLRFFGSARHTGDLKEKIRRSLEFVKLWDRRDDPLHTFSGGMRQRASLACALIHDPDLLVLDEPTAGVDPTLRQSFWGHFAELKQGGRAVFISTNQMDEALKCDRIAILRAGRVLISEAPENVLLRGKAKIDLKLISGRRTVEAVNYKEELPRLLAEYGLSADVEVISIRHPSLEEVILDLIEEEP